MIAFLSLALVAFLGSSCVNEEYDLSQDNLNLEVTPFQGGLTVPLGSTDQILLKELLNEVDTDGILNVDGNGAYAVSMNETLDMTEELKELKDLVSIPDVDYSQEISFRLSDVDVSDLKVDAQKYSFEYDMSSIVSYIPDLKFEFDPIVEKKTILSLSDNYGDYSSLVNDFEIPLDNSIITSTPDFSKTVWLPIDITLPKEIKSIRNIALKDGAGVNITVELSKSFLKSGKIIPDVDIDLHNLFHLSDATTDDIVHLADGLVLSDENNYKATQFVSLKSLALSDESWTSKDGCLVMNKTLDVTAKGKILWEDLMTTTRLLDSERRVDLDLNVEFVNIEVGDYEVEIAGYEQDLAFETEEIKVEIPKELADLKEITVYPEGMPSIYITLDMPELGLDIVPAAEGLRIYFPEMIRFNRNAAYEYDLGTNSICFRESFPFIEAGILADLVIDKLVLTPELDPTDNKYYARGKIVVEGGVGLSPGTLTKAQVEKVAGGADSRIGVDAYIDEIIPVKFDISTFSTTISETIDIDVMAAEDMPEELVSLGIVELEDTYINLAMDAYTLPNLGDASLSVEVDADLPDMIRIAGMDQNGILKLSGSMVNGKIAFDPIEVDALDFTGVDLTKDIKGTVKLDATIKLEDASLNVNEWLNTDLKADFKVGIKDIGIAKVTGKVAYDIEPVVETVDLSEFHDLLGDYGTEAVLDLNRVHLALEVLTNLGVPAGADVELIPYYDGVADAKNKITAKLELNPSESADVEAATRYWLSNVSKGMPEGYTFLEVKNILDLLKNVPEKLEIKVTAGTDPGQECVLEPVKDYTLKVNYQFVLPLEFGDEFEIEYRDTIPDMPEIIGELLATGNKVALTGEILNGLPLGLDIRFNFLDSDENVIPLAEGCGVQSIAPCGLDGTAASTKLNIVVGLKEGVDASDLASLELIMNANSGGITGTPVTDKAFLQARLTATLPEGVTIDLNDYLNDEE